MGSHTSGIDLEHLFLQDEVLSPDLFDVGFDGAPDRPEVVETSASSVDFESLEDYKSSFEQIVE